MPHKPGTHFLYNTPATYMLSAIVQKVTGETVLDYLRPRLFEPLGIENPEWGTSPQGISLGGYGLSIRTEDIAKFGQLYLQKGKWNGQATRARGVGRAGDRRSRSPTAAIPTKDWDQGYGFQFWRCRHGAYRGDGAFGQFCIVLPEQDAVVAITANTQRHAGGAEPGLGQTAARFSRRAAAGECGRASEAEADVRESRGPGDAR